MQAWNQALQKWRRLYFVSTRDWDTLSAHPRRDETLPIPVYFHRQTGSEAEVIGGLGAAQGLKRPVLTRYNVSLKDGPIPMECPECARLADELTRRKETYANVVERLFAIGYQLVDAEYLNLKASTEAARFQLEAAVVRLEQHCRIHPDARGPAS